MSDAGIILYQPSNGSEGEWFHARWCYKCAKFPHSQEAKNQCMIVCRSMIYKTEDKEYPREWRYVDDVPTCTAFKDRGEFNRERRMKWKPRKHLIAVSTDDMFAEIGKAL